MPWLKEMREHGAVNEGEAVNGGAQRAVAASLPMPPPPPAGWRWPREGDRVEIEVEDGGGGGDALASCAAMPNPWLTERRRHLHLVCSLS